MKDETNDSLWFFTAVLAVCVCLLTVGLIQTGDAFTKYFELERSNVEQYKKIESLCPNIRIDLNSQGWIGDTIHGNYGYFKVEVIEK